MRLEHRRRVRDERQPSQILVDPGAVRLAVTGGDAVAFKNPDGSIVTVLFNSAAQAATTTVALGAGTTVQVQVPAQGWATINWKG